MRDDSFGVARAGSGQGRVRTMAVDAVSSAQRQPPHAAYAVGQTLLWTLLAGTIAAVVVPPVFLSQPSRILLLKLCAGAVLAFLPGWLYLIFVERRGASLYDEYVINLFRLRIDVPCNLPMPPQHTSYYAGWRRAHDELDPGTTDNLYRRKFEEVFNARAVSTRPAIDRSRADGDAPAHTLWPENLSPIVVATGLFALGWVLVLQPELLRELDLLGGLSLSGAPQVPVEALQFAFVGAYAFILQDLIRRFFSGDLRTSAYVSATSRVVFVTLVVATLWLDQPELSRLGVGTAFFLGFFPRAGLQALQARVWRPVTRWVQHAPVERPLSEIEGMDIWWEARFVELGVENVQHLATANLVEVLLRSRVPVSRLVDWLDQAYLLLQLPADADQRKQVRTDLEHLGVRTATDLDRAVASACDDGALRDEVARILDLPACAVQAVIAALDHSPNYLHVRAFRAADWLRDCMPEGPGTAATERRTRGPVARA